VYALNPNFKLFSLKDMMYLSRWYCIYSPSTSWNCLQIVPLMFFYETTRWVPKNILKLLINSSFNWSTLTAVQTSTRDWMKTMKQATRIYIFIIISKV
jgi:hypothetical protein